MNAHAIALALRTAADNLARARQLAADLPPAVVDADSALALYLDAPRVTAALQMIAARLDPEGDRPAVPAAPASELVALLLENIQDDGVGCDLAEVAALSKRARS